MKILSQRSSSRFLPLAATVKETTMHLITIPTIILEFTRIDRMISPTMMTITLDSTPHILRNNITPTINNNSIMDRTIPTTNNSNSSSNNITPTSNNPTQGVECTLVQG